MREAGWSIPAAGPLSPVQRGAPAPDRTDTDGRGSPRSADGSDAEPLVAHADEGFGYETMFLLRARGSQTLDIDAIRDHLGTIGESVLVAVMPARSKSTSTTSGRISSLGTGYRSAT